MERLLAVFNLSAGIRPWEIRTTAGGLLLRCRSGLVLLQLAIDPRICLLQIREMCRVTGNRAGDSGAHQRAILRQRDALDGGSCLCKNHSSEGLVERCDLARAAGHCLPRGSGRALRLSVRAGKDPDVIFDVATAGVNRGGLLPDRRQSRNPAKSGTGGTVTAAQLRDRAGIGRALAIEVLEYFDRIKFTRRIGDEHHLLRSAWEAFGEKTPPL
jgi:hypothetical protein